MRRFVFGLFVTLASAACSSSSSPKAPGSGTCTFDALPAGAAVSFSSSGGFAGDSRSFVTFEDGRVEIRNSKIGPSALTANVGTDRVKRLTSDIDATGVHNEEQGCYAPDSPQSESTSSSLVLRRDGGTRAYEHADGADAPDALERALTVASKFYDEVAPLAK
jgi:hypothetical protein